MMKTISPIPVKAQRYTRTAEMWTNHFNLDLNIDLHVYQISLVIKPPLPKDQSYLMNQYVASAKTKMVAIVGEFFQTGDIIYAMKQLPEDSVPVLKDGSLTLSMQKTDQEFTVKELLEDSSNSQEIVRFLNVALKSFTESKGFKQYGKKQSYFPTNIRPTCIDQGINVLQGFNITIDKYLDKSIKLNIDICFRISSVDCIFFEYDDYANQQRDKEAGRAKFISENIIGKSFCIQNDFNKTVKITGVDSKKNLKSPSPVEGYPTMKDYFESKFGVRLKETFQLILYNEKKKIIKDPSNPSKKVMFPEKTYYPSELLFGMGLKDYQKKDNRLMKELAEITKQKPQQKMEYINKCAALMNNICNGSLNMKVSKSQPLSTSKIIDNPTYRVRDRDLQAKEGAIYINNDKLYSKVDLKKWAIIYESDDSYAEDFYDHLVSSFTQHGVTVGEPYWYKMDSKPRLNDFKEAIKDVMENGNTFILFMISKYTAENHYKKIKEHTDLRAQILTQVTKINPTVFQKKGFFDKLNYQICSKLGYPLWIVQKPFGLKDSDPLTMIIGADVYHNKGMESVSAVVGTINPDYSKYCSLSSVQAKRGQEIMDNISLMVIECVEEFKATNKKLPKKILFYRDGVGDTMIDLVKTKEIEKIKEELVKNYGKDRPSLTLVMVTKRISDKMFGTSGSSVVNPSSGTILSGHIVKNEMEFFMVAQKVTQGSSNPTRYQVLLNECEYDQQTLEEITFFQAFNYYGWSGAVKVPAVCQYAHKLAYHVGENYKQTNKFMKLNLYYL